MGTFDSVYQQKIRQLEEENKQLKKILNEGRIKDAIAKGLYKGYYKVLDKSLPVLGSDLARMPFDMLTFPRDFLMSVVRPSEDVGRGEFALGDRFKARMDSERRKEEKERDRIPTPPDPRQEAARKEFIDHNNKAFGRIKDFHRRGYQDGLEGDYGHWDDSRHDPDYLRGRARGTFKRVFGQDWVPYHPSEASDGHVSPEIGLAQAGLDERGSPLGTDHRANWEAQWDAATSGRDPERDTRFGHHSEY